MIASLLVRLISTPIPLSICDLLLYFFIGSVCYSSYKFICNKINWITGFAILTNCNLQKIGNEFEKLNSKATTFNCKLDNLTNESKRLNNTIDNIQSTFNEHSHKDTILNYLKLFGVGTLIEKLIEEIFPSKPNVVENHYTTTTTTTSLPIPSNYSVKIPETSSETSETSSETPGDVTANLEFQEESSGTPKSTDSNHSSESNHSTESCNNTDSIEKTYDNIVNTISKQE